MQFKVGFDNYAGRVQLKSYDTKPLELTDKEPVFISYNNPLNIVRRPNKTIPKGFPSINLPYEPHKLFNGSSNKEQFALNLTDDASDSDDDVKVLSTTDQDILNISYDTYMKTLTTRAIAVMNFCLTDDRYKPWIHNWKFLKTNIERTKLDFKRLDTSDQDIAYVIDKGSKVCFRIRDKERFVPLNIYQYVLYHEMAHMSTEELQHTKLFHELLNLLTLAAYELGFIDLTRLSKNIYTTNGQAILSATSLQDEIILGCNLMIKEWNVKNSSYAAYYEKLRTHVSSRC